MTPGTGTGTPDTRREYRLDDMNVASEVFGPEHEKVTLFMAWGSRVETPAEIAVRLLSTMRALTRLYPEAKAAFHTLEGDGLNSRSRLPETVEELTGVVAAKTDRDNNGQPYDEARTRLTALLLPDPTSPGLRSDAMLSMIAGTSLGLGNKLSVQFEDSFPMGSPAEAARWFSDVVRIWQPEYALLKTSLANSIHRRTSTYAGFLSWASRKALGPSPQVDSAISLPFGDGTLYAAREWTVDGIGAFVEELAGAGARSVLDIPEEQDLPDLPAGYPDGMECLDAQISWGPHLSAAHG